MNGVFSLGWLRSKVAFFLLLNAIGMAACVNQGVDNLRRKGRSPQLNALTSVKQDISFSIYKACNAPSKPASIKVAYQAKLSKTSQAIIFKIASCSAKTSVNSSMKLADAQRNIVILAYGDPKLSDDNIAGAQKTKESIESNPGYHVEVLQNPTKEQVQSYLESNRVDVVQTEAHGGQFDSGESYIARYNPATGETDPIPTAELMSAVKDSARTSAGEPSMVTGAACYMDISGLNQGDMAGAPNGAQAQASMVSSAQLVGLDQAIKDKPNPTVADWYNATTNATRELANGKLEAVQDRELPAAEREQRANDLWTSAKPAEQEQIRESLNTINNLNSDINQIAGEKEQIQQQAAAEGKFNYVDNNVQSLNNKIEAATTQRDEAVQSIKDKIESGSHDPAPPLRNQEDSLFKTPEQVKAENDTREANRQDAKDNWGMDIDPKTGEVTFASDKTDAQASNQPDLVSKCGAGLRLNLLDSCSAPEEPTTPQQPEEPTTPQQPEEPTPAVQPEEPVQPEQPIDSGNVDGGGSVDDGGGDW